MKIKVDNNDYDVEIIYKNIKNTYLRVRNNKVIVSTSKYTKEKDIKKFLESNVNSITKLIKNSKSNLPVNSPDVIYLFGKKLKINTFKSTKFEYEISFDTINVYTRNTEDIDNNIKKIYINELKLKTLEISKKIESYLKKDKYKTRRFSYKYMTSRWGSCKASECKISLNLHLAKIDYVYLEYVIHHEYAHYEFQDHSKNYYNFLKSIYPNYEVIRNELKKIIL